jgi:hypothetical protein
MRIIDVSVGLAALVVPLGAQCGEWSHIYAGPGLGSGSFPDVKALARFNGELYAGGNFLGGEGSTPFNDVARWDGAQWASLGIGLNGTSAVGVKAMIEFDDGTGSSLFVAGRFTAAGKHPVSNIACWDGSAWSQLADSGGEGITGSWVNALAVFDDGTGSALYVGGPLTQAGGVSVTGVARWDGTSWSALPPGPDGNVRALGVFDDGSGPRLVASSASFHGGAFTGFGAFDGTQWSALGAPPQGLAEDFEVFDDGGGPVLFAAGRFGATTSDVLARFDGSTWTTMGTVLSGSGGKGLAVFDDGAGPALFAAGSFKLGRWDGMSWSLVPAYSLGDGNALQVIDDGGGPRLIHGGELPGPSAWDGTTWSAMGSAPGGLSDTAHALVEHDDGSGSALYVGGEFDAAGGMAAARIARFDGTSWSPVGGGFDHNVLALCEYDDGSGVRLYAGGKFAASGPQPLGYLAVWDGSSWNPVGGGVNGRVEAMLAYDNGNGLKLFVAGQFTQAGGTSFGGIARWDGAVWKKVGNGLGNIQALGVYESASGPTLIAATGASLATWTSGPVWTHIAGAPRAVETFLNFDDGSGKALYVGGSFSTAGGLPAINVARYDGSTWSPVGAGLEFTSGMYPGTVHALAEFDDGTGDRLYASGYFDLSLARWDGTTWTSLGTHGPSAESNLIEFDGALHFAGRFGGIGSAQGSYITEHLAGWGPGCHCDPVPYCTAGTTTNGCVPAISATGQASRTFATGFSVSVANVEGAKLGFLYFGVTGPKATAWGAGTSYACVLGPHTRTAVQNAGGTAGQCDGSFALDFNAWMSANPLRAPDAGATAWMQAYFRDPPAPKTTNLSDALELYVCP